VGKKKLKLADPFDALDKESIKRLRQKQEDNSEENDEKSEQQSSPTEPHPNTLLPDSAKDVVFLKAAMSSFEDLAKRGEQLRLNFMLNDLKQTGLYDYVVKKHGGITSFFLQTRDFGITVDHYLSLKGHCERLVQEARRFLEVAPKRMMKIQDLEVKMKTRLTASAMQEQLRGYPDFVKALEAHRNDFAVDKKKVFVLLKKQGF